MPFKLTMGWRVLVSTAFFADLFVHYILILFHYFE